MNEIQALKPRNLHEVKVLLTDLNLPHKDIDNKDIQLFEFRVNGLFMGTGGLEKAGSDVLIRSVAVIPKHQNTGIGKSIVEYLEKYARENKQKKVYLLTEIPDYFVKLNYRSLERKYAPESISKTEEFRSLCPDSATLMIKTLV